MRTFNLLLLVFLIQAISCKKDHDPVEAQTAHLQFFIGHRSDSLPLRFDTVFYRNAAGEDFSVSRLEYYISNVRLIGDQVVFESREVHYMNARNYAGGGFPVKGVPKGHYTRLEFLLGVDSQRNIPDGLPATVENNAMFWPVPMGGGYHFMKLEGHFKDTAGVSGYAVHLGRNGNTVAISIPCTFDISGPAHRMVLTMNINQWFQDPLVYSFIRDGKYTMSSMPLMQKIAGNGQDIFTSTFIP